MKAFSLTKQVLVAAGALCLAANESNGQDWQATTSPTQWLSIACSADGTRVLAVQPEFGGQLSYASTNSGATWNFQEYAGDGPSANLAASGDGSSWLVPGWFLALVQYSPAGGWSDVLLAYGYGSLAASSANSMTLLSGGATVDYSGQVVTNNYTTQASLDGGFTWNVVLSNVAIKALACSASGSTFLAASTNNVIYISTNSGTNWSTNLVDAGWTGSWNSLASSADGSRIFAASEDGVFVSTNAGLQWAQIHAADSFQSIAVSADGTQIAAAARVGLIYTSTNSGVNWDQATLSGLSGYTNANDIITKVAMSADGAKMFAAPLYGSIYTRFSVPPIPPLKIAPAGTNLTLSWPCPSLNYVLQQTTDLTTHVWQDITTVPVLSPILQDEIVLPTPGKQMFYRLEPSQALPSSFQDLDFESGTNVPGGAGIEFAPAFPGWTGYIGTNQQTWAFFNNLYLDSPSLGLQEYWPMFSQTNDHTFSDGKYFASIQSSSFWTTGPVLSSLSQTGTIPPAAHSLYFKAAGDWMSIGTPVDQAFVVSLNGQALKVVPHGGYLFGVSVSNFSGTMAELRFTGLTAPPPHPPVQTLFIDSIYFSTRPVQ